MNIEKIIDYRYLFMSMCFFIALKYFQTDKPQFVVEYS